MAKVSSSPKIKKYSEAVGRRKTSTARVRLTPGNGQITVNDLAIEDYFPGKVAQNLYRRPFDATVSRQKYNVSARVIGGGKNGQLEAVILGVARSLAKMSKENRLQLKKHGLLSRDPRMVERKKPGRVKARKKRQSPKR